MPKPKLLRNKMQTEGNTSKQKRVIKKRKTREASYNATQLQNDVIELSNVKATLKTLKAREEELKTRVSEGMDKLVSPDSVGHYTYPVTNAEGKKLYFQKQARKKITMNQEKLRELLEKKEFTRIAYREVPQVATEVTGDQILDVLEKHAPHLVDTVEVLDEQELEMLVLSGDISEEEFEGVMDTVVNYAHTFVDAKLVEKEEETD